MNVKRFQARTSKEALTLARQFFGDDAVVLSTRPCGQGVEVMAMSADAVNAVTAPPQSPALMPTPAAAVAPAGSPRPATPGASPVRPGTPAAPVDMAMAGDPAVTGVSVEQDVGHLAMSTLSFQEYVRERMLRKRHEAMTQAQPGAPRTAVPAALAAERPATSASVTPEGLGPTPQVATAPARRAGGLNTAELRARAQARQSQEPAPASGGLSLDLTGRSGRAAPDTAPALLDELRAMKGLIEERFGTMAWLDRVQRSPAQVRLMQQMLGNGYSPALVRKVIDGLPSAHEQDQALAWAEKVLAHNLLTDENAPALEDRGGIYALVGSTGVGKTTTTAKLAAAFALKHGAGQLGLVTLDAYRVGAHDQLRAYGRILGVAVHIAHDRAALEDLLALLSTKKMVLIDTVGLAQRDARTRDMLDMLAIDGVQKLLVVNAAAQAETIEDVMTAYRDAPCAGVILSKVDEAVKLGPALDAALRRKTRIVGVADGQRVPEDWQRAKAADLVHRSLSGTTSPVFEMDKAEAGLMFSLRSESMRISGGGLHA